MIQTTDQKRAKNAWEQIEQVEKELDSKEKYGSWARGLPAMIQINGLGQTLAFLCAKGKGDSKNHQTLLYRHLSNWVYQQMTGEEKAKDLLEWIIKQDSGNYRRATSEALAYSLWLRRFAEGKGWGKTEDIKED